MKHICKQLLAISMIIAVILSLSACIFDKEPEHTHDYSEWGSNQTHHWKFCPDDKVQDESTKAKHYDNNLDGKCDACGHEVALPHTHNYSAWGYDAENHWKYCPDDNEKDTTSIAPHADTDNDGKCDACGQDVEAPVTESVTIETVEGVPTLIVKGPTPVVENVTIGALRLHAEANGTHLFWDNQSKFASSYEFKVALTDLPVSGTPWCWFHIDAYVEAAPTDASEPAARTNLPRGDAITVGSTYQKDDTIYEIIADGESTQLIIQPKPAPKASVTSMEMKVVENKMVLVVKGTKLSTVGYVNLHADGNDGDQFFGKMVSSTDTTFESHFDLTQVPISDTPWLWFHVYTYADAEPADMTKGFDKIDLQRGTHFAVNDFVDFGGTRFTVQNQGQLVIQPTKAPEFTVQSVTVETDTDGKPYVVVKGIMPTTIACTKLHADANNQQYYADNVSTEAGKFEFRFDLTQVPVDGTPWIWFHVYTYADANPTDLSAKLASQDLKRGDFLPGEHSYDYDGVRYSIINEGNWGNVVFQPNPISAE